MGKSPHLSVKKVSALPASASRRLDIARLPKCKSQLMLRPLLDSQSLIPCPSGAEIAGNVGFCSSHSSTDCLYADNFLSAADGIFSEKAPSEEAYSKERI